MTQIIFYVILAVTALPVVIVLANGRNTIKQTLFSATCGICTLGTLNLLSSVTGIALTVNYATCFIAAVLSIPGVVLMVALQLLFNI